MKNQKLLLAGVLFLSLLPALQGCFPAVVGGAAVGVLSAYDRRQTGVQTDDEATEWKAAAGIPAQYKETAHVNFTSYNRIVLITGEVPNEEARQAIGDMVLKLNGVRLIHNELGIGPATPLASRSTDSFITSKVKARLVDSKEISAHRIKVVTERGIAHLMGIVSAHEAKVAIQVARTTDGVRKVVNVMEVLPDAEIRRIDAALPNAAGKSAAPAAPVENR